MAGNDSLNASVIHGGVRYLSSALRATLSPIFASLSQRGWFIASSQRRMVRSGNFPALPCVRMTGSSRLA